MMSKFAELHRLDESVPCANCDTPTRMVFFLTVGDHISGAVPLCIKHIPVFAADVLEQLEQPAEARA
jgi:hypothetical protein